MKSTIFKYKFLNNKTEIDLVLRSSKIWQHLTYIDKTIGRAIKHSFHTQTHTHTHTSLVELPFEGAKQMTRVMVKHVKYFNTKHIISVTKNNIFNLFTSDEQLITHLHFQRI